MPRSFRSKVVGDGIYTLALRLVNMVVAAAVGIVTARALGPEGRGIYAMPMVDAALVTAAFSGLSTATSYFLLRKNAGRGVFRAAFLTAGSFVAVGALVTVGLAALTHHIWACIPAMISLPGAASLVLVYGYAIGTHRVRINTSLALLNTIVLFGFMLTFITIFGARPTAAIIAWVSGTNLLGAGIITWMVLDARKRFPEATERIGLRQYGSYAIRVGSVSLVTLLNYRADVYLVAYLTTPAMLGMYTLAVTAAETLLAATQVTSQVMLPHVGSMELKAAEQLTARCVRHNVIVAATCCGVLAIIAPMVVHALYGPQFLPMVGALRVLLVGVFALSLGSPMSNFFTVRLGKPEVPLLLAGISAAICIGSSIVLIPRIGLVGAALASTLAYILGQSAAIGYFSSFSGISAFRVLVPRLSDLATYIEILSGFARRLRPNPGP